MSASETSSQPLGDALQRLEEAVRRAGSPVMDLMMPGVDPDVVRSALRPLGMEPPDELLTWFGWRNGFPMDAPAWSGRTSFLSWAPFSLQGAITEYHALQKGPEHWQWQPTWLPLAHSGSAPRIAVDCTRPQASQATVRAADPYAGLFDENQVPSVRGLASVISTWVEAIDIGAFVYLPSPTGGGWEDTPKLLEHPLAWRQAGLM